MRFLKYIAKKILPFKTQHQLADMFFTINGWFYRGKNVHCPICKGNFTKFLPFKERANSQCPGCGSLERQRFLWLFLANETNFFSAKLKFLQFAPELYLQKKFKAQKNIDYVSTDLYSTLAEIQTDIQDMKVFGDNSFDALLCSHVLDHVDDDRKAMRELLRVLKPGGWAIIQSSIDLSREKTWDEPEAKTPQERLRIFGQADLARKYGVDIKERLNEAGFKTQARKYGKELGEQAVKEYGTYSNANIYYCEKPA